MESRSRPRTHPAPGVPSGAVGASFDWLSSGASQQLALSLVLVGVGALRNTAWITLAGLVLSPLARVTFAAALSARHCGARNGLALACQTLVHALALVAYGALDAAISQADPAHAAGLRSLSLSASCALATMGAVLAVRLLAKDRVVRVLLALGLAGALPSYALLRAGAELASAQRMGGLEWIAQGFVALAVLAAVSVLALTLDGAGTDLPPDGRDR